MALGSIRNRYGLKVRMGGKSLGRVAKRKPVVPRRKATTRLIKQVLNRQLETKYVASDVSSGGAVLKNRITPSLDYLTILPPVNFQSAGTPAASNLREGDQIEPIRATVRGHIWFNPDENQTSSKILFVKMFVVQSKTIKSPAFAGNLDSGLLENGTGNPVSWVSSSEDFQTFYPVCKQNYTLLKTRTFKFVKNVGECIADVSVGNSPNIGQDRRTFSYSWKPPTLKYANEAQNQPTNHFPIMFLVAYAPGLDIQGIPELATALLYNWHTEMYYKDA